MTDLDFSLPSQYRFVVNEYRRGNLGEDGLRRQLTRLGFTDQAAGREIELHRKTRLVLHAVNT